MKAIICMSNHEMIDRTTKAIWDIGRTKNINIEEHSCKSAEALMFNMEDDPNQYDIIILDTDLFQEDGINTARTMREKYKYKNEIIFLTGDDSKVFESFEAEPLNYILYSELKNERFERTVVRAYRRSLEKKAEMISVSWGGETRNINLNDIYYFESTGRIIEVTYGNNFKFQFYMPIGKLENLLIEKGFVRIHKSIVASKSKISSLTRKEAKMSNGETISVGRAYYSKAKEEIKNVG